MCYASFVGFERDTANVAYRQRHSDRILLWSLPLGQDFMMPISVRRPGYVTDIKALETVTRLFSDGSVIPTIAPTHNCGKIAPAPWIRLDCASMVPCHDTGRERQ